MANDLDFLARRMNQIANQVETRAPQVVRHIANAMVPVLVYATPVLTSRARANWQAGIGMVPQSVLFSEPDKPPSPDYGGRAAVAAILGTVAIYPGGTYLAIANNVPYIQRLNRGWSAQAPAAFVQQSVAVGLRALRRFRILT
jgi:hypothetical protein